MSWHLNWISRRGSLRPENRDFCGIALKPHASFFMVVDGTTQGTSGDQLAKELVHFMVDKFMSASSELNEINIINILKDAHNGLHRKFPAASASYIILLAADNSIHKVLHSGDCRLGGCLNYQNIEWKTTIHSVINILGINDTDVAQDPLRHTLTQSFRPRHFIEPELTEINVENYQLLLLSTDGFWAELPSNLQYPLISEGLNDSISTTDDLSCLIISKAGSFKIQSQTDNMYYLFAESMNVEFNK